MSLENYIVMLTIVKEILSMGRMWALMGLAVAWHLPEVINALAAALK